MGWESRLRTKRVVRMEPLKQLFQRLETGQRNRQVPDLFTWATPWPLAVSAGGKDPSHCVSASVGGLPRQQSSRLARP